jgi:predicted Co/Zn/Cd cation transporter (cation efflux family)
MDRERFAIRLSAGTNVFMGVLGVTFGVWLTADSILLDGVFNWVSFLLALVSMRVARLVTQEATDSYPFGYAAFEPLVNTIKSLIVIGVSIVAFVAAVADLVAGGHQLEPGWALVYAAIAVAGCFALFFVQRHYAKRTRSPLLEVDAKNWLVNGLVSSAVGLAFVVALLVQGTGAAFILPYIDSTLVILLVVVSVPIPVRMAREGLTELLGIAPPLDMRVEVHRHFDEAARAQGLEQYTLRMTRTGRTLFLFVSARTPADRTAAELHTLREAVVAAMRTAHPHLVMDIAFRPAG